MYTCPARVRVGRVTTGAGEHMYTCPARGRVGSDYGFRGRYVLEIDRMSKFAYPRMWIRIRIPAREALRMRIHIRMLVQEDPRMRIHMRIPVSRYPRMRKRMRIFVTYLNNTSYCQMGVDFVTEYRLLHYNDHADINY